MEQINLKATLREQKGTRTSKKLRQSGLIPGVVYHRGEQPIAVSFTEKEISKILKGAGGENVLINLTVDKTKKKSRSVIVKEVQHHPVKHRILHVDFNEISLTEKITVDVEVVAMGESVGVKLEGGILDHTLRTLKVQCLPGDIPKNVEVDVTELKLGGAIAVKDLKLAGEIKVLNDPETLLFQVRLPVVEEKVEEAPPTAAPEVEVIHEKKEEEPKAGAEKVKEEPKTEKK